MNIKSKNKKTIFLFFCILIPSLGANAKKRSFIFNTQKGRISVDSEGPVELTASRRGSNVTIAMPQPETPREGETPSAVPKIEDLETMTRNPQKTDEIAITPRTMERIKQTLWANNIQQHITEMNHPLSAGGLLAFHILVDAEKRIQNLSYSTAEKRDKVAKLITEALLANLFNTILPVMHSSLKGQNGWTFIASYLMTHLLGKEGLEALTTTAAKTNVGKSLANRFKTLPEDTQSRITSLLSFARVAANFLAAYTIASFAH